MNSQDTINSKKNTAMDSLKHGALMGLIFGLAALFAIYFITKIVLA